MGVVVGIPSVLAAWVYAAWIGKRIFVDVPQDMVEAAEEAKAAVAAEQRAAGVTPREEPGRRSAPSSRSSAPRWC